MNPALVKILACPISGQKLETAPASVLAHLNSLIERGALFRQDGTSVTGTLESGLLREDGQVFYALRDGIALLLAADSIAVPSPST